METDRPSFVPGRKWRVGFNVILSSLLLFAIAAMLNYISGKYFRRWSSSGPAITAITKQVLSSLTNEVKVIVFFDRVDPLFPSVSSLLNDYKLLSPQLQVEYVDYRYPGRADVVRERYKFAGESDGNRVIFDANNRVRVVTEKELSVYDYDGIFRGQEIRRTAFRGEQLFTSAIYSVTSGDQPKALILQGHGEKHDPESEDTEGFSRFTKLLEESNVKVDQFHSLHAQDIPDDCDLVVLPAPTEKFGLAEVQRLQKFLERGGRMLMLYNYSSSKTLLGLENLFATYGIDVGHNVVQDSSESQDGDGRVLYVGSFGSHPVVSPLAHSSKLAMVMPRTIGMRKGYDKTADAATVTELAFTSQDGVALLNETIERTGEIPVIAAAEKGGIAGLGSDRGRTRIIIAGDSLFLANGVIRAGGGNADFASLAVNWLLSREVLLGDIPPRAVEEYRLMVSKTKSRQMKALFLVIVPGGVLALGTLVWLRRRA